MSGHFAAKTRPPRASDILSAAGQGKPEDARPRILCAAAICRRINLALPDMALRCRNRRSRQGETARPPITFSAWNRTFHVPFLNAIEARCEARMTIRLKPVFQQVIVITGASSGIGLVTARAAAGRGAAVVLVARQRSAIDEAAEDIRRCGGRAASFAADVADAEAVRRRRAEGARDLSALSIPGSTMPAFPVTAAWTKRPPRSTGGSSKPTTGEWSTDR